jgi:3-oxoacyl-[acyl-carrier protein] reductase
MVAPPAPDGRPPVAIVTGVGRSIGIGAAIGHALRADGWTVVGVGWRGYDARMPWGADPDHLADIEADLADPEVPARVVDQVRADVGAVTGLVLCHCESVDSSIDDTTVESFDRHMAVNARATWLLVRAFAAQFPGPSGSGRIVSLTSDHTAHNLPYGASKGAMDRIVLAAAVELADLGVTANVVNPGATQTGWMDDGLEAAIAANTLAGRVGRPDDAARLVAFLCSDEGRWINGQLLASDGGRRR